MQKAYPLPTNFLSFTNPQQHTRNVKEMTRKLVADTKHREKYRLGWYHLLRFEWRYPPRSFGRFLPGFFVESSGRSVVISVIFEPSFSESRRMNWIAPFCFPPCTGMSKEQEMNADDHTTSLSRTSIRSRLESITKRC